MTNWKIHLCNARGQLDRHVGAITKALARCHTECRRVHAPVPVDIIVQAARRPAPPELFVHGYSFAPGSIEIYVDTAHDVADHTLFQATQKTLFHEFHHVLRWDGPGPGTSLGEALVFEGLAQVFVHDMMDCPDEPWENALSDDDLNRFQSRAKDAFHDTTYSHADWFWGAGDLPNWTGYTVGANLVRRYLAANPSASALSCARHPAQVFESYLA